ncbi:MAG: glycerophosphodiester phosphodiesterase family protein [Actinomycetota bacterium]
MVAKKVVNVAHRGASGYAPENTLAAFDVAIGLGADVIEFDLRMTADGALLVFHDPQLGRTTRPKRNRALVADVTLEQVRGLSAGSWFNQRFPWHAREEFESERIPTLEEILVRYAGSIGLLIDLKDPSTSPATVPRLLHVLADHGVGGPAQLGRGITVASFCSRSLLEIRASNEHVRLMQLFDLCDPCGVPELQRSAGYAEAVGLWRDHLDPTLVDGANDAGLEFYSYTVNEVDDLSRAMHVRVDGVITNFPDRLARVLRQVDPQARRRPRYTSLGS